MSRDVKRIRPGLLGRISYIILENELATNLHLHFEIRDQTFIITVKPVLRPTLNRRVMTIEES